MQKHRSPKKTGTCSQSLIAGNQFLSIWYPVSGALVPVLLVGLCAWISFHKVARSKSVPFFDANNGTGFYWTESAFHFRHARMVAEGKKIPPRDTDIQYPEGLDTVRHITPVMENVSGRLYRLLRPGVPLHVFLIYFMCFFSTVSVVAIFVAAKLLWRSSWAGLLSAVFYCLSPASFVRSTGGFVRENFALPFIFLSVACFIYCLRKDSLLVAIIGSLLLAVALAAWHLTQFYLLLFVGGFIITFFLQKTDGLPKVSFTVLTAAAFVCAITLPILRAKQFAFSFALVFAYALVVVLWLLPKRIIEDRRQRAMWGGLIILVFLAAGFAIQKYLGNYSYIYDFIISKFRYFSGLPEDPSLIPFATRLTWRSSFISPTFQDILVLLSSTIVPGAAVVLWLIVRLLKRKARQEEIIAVYLALAGFALFCIVYRLCVFAIFFLALLTGAVALVKKLHWRILSYTCVIGCLAFALWSVSAIQFTIARPSQGHLINLIDFIKSDVDEDDVVLSSFQLGPSIAAYTHRPVVLHSKFESQIIRDKVENVYKSLYGSEEDFFGVCSRYGAKLFIYQRDMVLGTVAGSIRYMAGFSSLRRNCAAALFHFAPEKLSRFRLIHQNSIYRVFAVGEMGSEIETELTYEPIYDLSVYCDQHWLGEYISDSVLAHGYAELGRPQTHKRLGDKFLAKRDFRTAALQYYRALLINPKHVAAKEGIRTALYQSGDVNDLPNESLWLMLGHDELTAGKYTWAEWFFRGAVRLAPDSGSAYLGLGTALLSQNKTKQAADALEHAVAADPTSYAAYEILGKAYAALAKYDKAIEALQASLSLNPNQPHLHRILGQLRQLASEERRTKGNKP